MLYYFKQETNGFCQKKKKMIMLFSNLFFFKIIIKEINEMF